MAAETTTRTLRWYDHLFINSNWFALTLRSQVLAGLIQSGGNMQCRNVLGGIIHEYYRSPTRAALFTR